MWNEFMEIAGYEVTYETYSKVIEPMYMALPANISKQEFVKMLDKKAFALPTKRQLVNEMKKLAEHLYDICGHRGDFEAEQKLDRLAKAYAERFYHLNWNNDLKAYCYFRRGYEYPNQRGCSYPRELVIGRDYHDYEHIVLVNDGQ